MEYLTYEQLMMLFAETREQMKISSERVDKQLAENAVQMKVLSEQVDKLLAENAAQMKISSEQVDKQLAETAKYIKNIGKQVGELTDTLGRFAEEQVRPRILRMFEKQGIELEEIYQHVQVKENGKFLLEIDLLLVNTVYSVVVEVKNTLRKQDIDEHIQRLAKLQRAPSRLIKGTTMYGAIAGMIVSDEAEQYAIKQGLYVIKPKGDSVVISNKRGFKAATWAIDAVGKK